MYNGCIAQLEERESIFECFMTFVSSNPALGSFFDRVIGIYPDVFLAYIQHGPQVWGERGGGRFMLIQDCTSLLL